VKLSRNTFFYKELKFDDKLENRIIIIFAHLSIILNCMKKHKKYNTISQEIYDNIFLNIENNLREIGHGDVTVNKKMKQLNQIFHNILIKLFDITNNKKIKISEITNFLFLKDKSPEISQKLTLYFEKYNDFCFDIIDKNMIKDLVNFKY